jgi:transcriptional regulator with XRE-family HTH domain
MLSFLPKTPTDVMHELSTKFKARRKSLGLTQIELATRSGVSLGSLKRFEGSGQIALESLLKLALVLECLGEFSAVCCEVEEGFESIEEVVR